MPRGFIVLLCIAGTAALEGRAPAGGSRPDGRAALDAIVAGIPRIARDARQEAAPREVTGRPGGTGRALMEQVAPPRSTGPETLDGRVLPRGVSMADQGRDLRQEQTDRQTRTLAIGASGVLELRNVSGDIAIKAGGGREAVVAITRVARGRTAADAKLGLEQVIVDVVTRGDRGSVTARYPDTRRLPYSVSVAYQVTAPAGTRLVVNSIGGDLTIAGVKGEITASTVSGDVLISDAGDISAARTVSGDVTIRHAASDRAMEVGTMSGTVQLEGVTARRLAASAVSGSIRLRDIKAGIVNATCMSGDIEFSGTVASNGRYEFKNHAGNIRLALGGDFDFEARTFSGGITTDPALKLPPASGRTRSLRGTVGQGGALVDVTTFNGDIWVGRALKQG